MDAVRVYSLILLALTVVWQGSAASPITTTTTLPPRVYCAGGYSYVAYVHSCVKIYTNPDTNFKSMAKCQADGAFVLTVNNALEASFFAREYIPRNLLRSLNIWINLFYNGKDWKSRGQSATIANSLPSPPQGNCGVLKAHGNLTNAQCDSDRAKNSILCQKPLEFYQLDPRVCPSFQGVSVTPEGRESSTGCIGQFFRPQPWCKIVRVNGTEVPQWQHIARCTSSAPAPPNVRLSGADGTSMLIAWDASFLPESSGFYAGYRVQWHPQGNPPVGVQTSQAITTATTTTAIITGLVPETSYVIGVAVVSTTGYYGHFTTVTFKTDVNRPVPPAPEITAQETVSESRCPEPYKVVMFSCYRVLPNVVPPASAHSACEEDGAKLADTVSTSDNLMNWIKQAIAGSTLPAAAAITITAKLSLVVCSTNEGHHLTFGSCVSVASVHSVCNKAPVPVSGK